MSNRFKRAVEAATQNTSAKDSAEQTASREAQGDAAAAPALETSNPKANQTKSAAGGSGQGAEKRPGQTETETAGERGESPGKAGHASAARSILDEVAKSEKKAKGRNQTIYLSSEVSEALDAMAARLEMSRSELVDKILKKVLAG